MASEDSNSQRRRTWEKLRELGHSLHRRTFLRFSDDSTIARRGSSGVTQPAHSAHGCEHIVRLMHAFLKYDIANKQLNGIVAIWDEKGKDLLIVSGNRSTRTHRPPHNIRIFKRSTPHSFGSVVHALLMGLAQHIASL